VSDGNEWKNSTSHPLIRGLYEPSDLNTDKLRRSLSLDLWRRNQR